MNTKVLVIDDSALIRNLLTEIINQQDDMEVVGAAPDSVVAREMVKRLKPDVLTLDVEMPKMNGLDFLEKLMRLHPIPVVMVSALTDKGSEITLRALELGATDFITKPKIGISDGMREYTDIIAEKIRIASKASTASLQRIAKQSQQTIVSPGLIKNSMISNEKLLVIGASIGGTEAIKSFLLQMPLDCPGILITQHMPASFTATFANHLDSLCKISVSEAIDGERILPGHAYIASGDRHLLLAKRDANYITKLSDANPVSGHKPSVDVLFGSVADVAGENAIGVILTGMGKDGASGMVKMKEAGTYNFAQDEESCVVFGMPKEAIAYGGVDEVLALKYLPQAALCQLTKGASRTLQA